MLSVGGFRDFWFGWSAQDKATFATVIRLFQQTMGTDQLPVPLQEGAFVCSALPKASYWTSMLHVNTGQGVFHPQIIRFVEVVCEYAQNCTANGFFQDAYSLPHHRMLFEMCSWMCGSVGAWEGDNADNLNETRKRQLYLDELEGFFTFAAAGSRDLFCGTVSLRFVLLRGVEILEDIVERLKTSCESKSVLRVFQSVAVRSDWAGFLLGQFIRVFFFGAKSDTQNVKVNGLEKLKAFLLDEAKSDLLASTISSGQDDFPDEPAQQSDAFAVSLDELPKEFRWVATDTAAKFAILSLVKGLDELRTVQAFAVRGANTARLGGNLVVSHALRDMESALSEVLLLVEGMSSLVDCFYNCCLFWYRQFGARHRMAEGWEVNFQSLNKGVLQEALTLLHRDLLDLHTRLFSTIYRSFSTQELVVRFHVVTDGQYRLQEVTVAKSSSLRIAVVSMEEKRAVCFAVNDDGTLGDSAVLDIVRRDRKKGQKATTYVLRDGIVAAKLTGKVERAAATLAENKVSVAWRGRVRIGSRLLEEDRRAPVKFRAAKGTVTGSELQWDASDSLVNLKKMFGVQQSSLSLRDAHSFQSSLQVEGAGPAMQFVQGRRMWFFAASSGKEQDYVGFCRAITHVLGAGKSSGPRMRKSPTGPVAAGTSRGASAGYLSVEKPRTVPSSTPHAQRFDAQTESAVENRLAAVKARRQAAAAAASTANIDLPEDKLPVLRSGGNLSSLNLETAETRNNTLTVSKSAQGRHQRSLSAGNVKEADLEDEIMRAMACFAQDLLRLQTEQEEIQCL